MRVSLFAVEAVVWAWIGIGMGVTATASIAHADANDHAATCDHRGYMHITRHGGKEADDEWHRRHGQAVTCDDDKSKDDPEHDTEPDEPRHLPGEEESDEPHDEHRGDGKAVPRRDHEGFACTIHGCG